MPAIPPVAGYAEPASRIAGVDSLTRHWMDQVVRSPRPRVVLTDGDDPRIVRAAEDLARTGALRLVLIGRAAMLTEVANSTRGDGDVEVIDPRADPWGETMRELASSPYAVGWPSLVDDPLAFGAALVRLEYADACVGGSMRPTRDVVRTGIRIIGLASDSCLVSSCFLMVLADGRVIAYADCAVVPDPTSDQLADIAIATAGTYQSLTGDEPVVAMLSFSTKGSASHERVDRVRLAVDLVRERSPNLQVDGELQFDAAWVAEVGHRKAPGSSVVGRANVFIYPSLDAGNVAYKITERLAGAQAIGPILQGLAHPINDLSRGCSAEDVATLALVSAVQASTPVGGIVSDQTRGTRND